MAGQVAGARYHSLAARRSERISHSSKALNSLKKTAAHSLAKTKQNPQDLSRNHDRVDPRLFSPNDHHSYLRRSVRSREPLTLPQNSIGNHRSDVRLANCPVGSVSWTCSIFRNLCKAIRVNPITLGPRDRHHHLGGFLGYPEQG
ncbi:hypothetical protein CRG98_019035 [Punica granatum]|uniref:Uncharacterized protein n=1 Tax=Punica granatum TaxID=22663 RepID=A0A2I0JW65_PUNGR|nr:hypothetical protein CRG98_019035 [Punica granatum]